MDNQLRRKNWCPCQYIVHIYSKPSRKQMEIQIEIPRPVITLYAPVFLRTITGLKWLRTEVQVNPSVLGGGMGRSAVSLFDLLRSKKLNFLNFELKL